AARGSPAGAARSVLRRRNPAVAKEPLPAGSRRARRALWPRNPGVAGNARPRKSPAAAKNDLRAGSPRAKGVRPGNPAAGNVRPQRNPAVAGSVRRATSRQVAVEAGVAVSSAPKEGPPRPSSRSGCQRFGSNAVANMMIVAAPNTPVATQLRTLSAGGIGNRPMVFLRLAISMISTISGTATTPLITALQNSILMGSIGVKLNAMPPSVAAAIAP